MPSITTSTASDAKVLMFDDITLTCTATGIPPPIITWSKDSVAITHSALKFNISSDNMTLTIHNMIHTDNGSYLCLAKNEAGTDSRQFNLSVIGMQFIKQILSSRKLKCRLKQQKKVNLMSQYPLYKTSIMYCIYWTSHC